VHTTFPYKEFGYWCDAIMPQIYHFSTSGLKKSPSAGINLTDVSWRKWQNDLVGSNTVVNGQTIYWTNSIKPLVPINDVYGPLFTGPLPDKDVMEFVDYLAADPNVVPGGYNNGVNFFRSELHGTNQWANIKNATSGEFPNVVNNIVIDDAKATVAGAWTSVKTFSATTTSATYSGATGSD